jgi:hypothetical protein
MRMAAHCAASLATPHRIWRCAWLLLALRSSTECQSVQLPEGQSFTADTDAAEKTSRRDHHFINRACAVACVLVLSLIQMGTRQGICRRCCAIAAAVSCRLAASAARLRYQLMQQDAGGHADVQAVHCPSLESIFAGAVCGVAAADADQLAACTLHIRAQTYNACNISCTGLLPA